MPASKAQQKAVHKYTKENYDRFLISMKPKGHLEEVKAHATARGESTNAFINRAISEAMERDAGSPTDTGMVSLPSDTLEAAQEAAEAAGEAMPVFITRAIKTQAQRDALSRNLSAKTEGGKPNE